MRSALLALVFVAVVAAAAAAARADSAECLGFSIPRGYQRVVSKAGRAVVVQAKQGYELAGHPLHPSLTVEISPGEGLPLISWDNEDREQLVREGNAWTGEYGVVTRLTHDPFDVRPIEISGVRASRWQTNGVVELFGTSSVRYRLILIHLVVRDRRYSISAGWDLARERTDRPASEAFLASLRVLPACR